MAKKKDQNRKQVIATKNAVESLKFQTHFGLKMMGRANDDIFQQLAETELNFIGELNLTQDILDLKTFVEGIKKDLGVIPTPEKGDFCTSITAIALGIASITDLDNMKMPISWQEQIAKKILTIYYPKDYRNPVVDWANAHNYNTSTYLGCPIIKYKKIYVTIKSTREGKE